jgi:subtilase family serine protease
MRSGIAAVKFVILVAFTAVQCSINEDPRDNPKDPKSVVTQNSADLVISAFNTAASYTNNVTYNFTVTVTNQGAGAAGFFYVAVNTGSSSGSLDNYGGYSYVFAGRTGVDSLAAGAATTVTVSFKPVFTSMSLIGAFADSEQTVTEKNENNNHKINNVTIN